MSSRAIELKRLDPRLGSSEFPLPDYATAASAGMDLRAMIEAPLTLEPGASALVPSGLAIHIGDPGLCAVVARPHVPARLNLLGGRGTPHRPSAGAGVRGEDVRLHSQPRLHGAGRQVTGVGDAGLDARQHGVVQAVHL